MCTLLPPLLIGVVWTPSAASYNGYFAHRCQPSLSVCFPNTPQADEPAMYKPQDLPHGSVYSLDSHHSHFVLVEGDPNRPGATSEMRVKLLKHISLQRCGYGGKKSSTQNCTISPLFDLSQQTLSSRTYTVLLDLDLNVFSLSMVVKTSPEK